MVLRKLLTFSSTVCIVSSFVTSAPAAVPSSPGSSKPRSTSAARALQAPSAPARTPSAASRSSAAPSRSAQPPPSRQGSIQKQEPPPALVKKARDLWYRGVDAFRNGDYEAARLAFAECYQLMPKSDVLRNLSISEIHSGHYVSAARHLTQLLAAPGELPPNVRQEATTRLAQAEAQIGQLGIQVDVAGADIRVDGVSIGSSPLEGKWYVDPGQHEIAISKPGYPVERRQVFALAGVLIPVEVSLEARRREQAADALAAELMGTSEGQAPVRVDDSDGLSTGSTVAFAALGTIAAVGLAGGIVYTLAADDHESEAEQLTRYLAGAVECGPPAPAAFAEECSTIADEHDRAKRDRTLAIVGFAGFGVASAGILGYALWLALDENEIDPATTLGLEPVISVGIHGASVGLGARF